MGTHTYTPAPLPCSCQSCYAQVILGCGHGAHYTGVLPLLPEYTTEAHPGSGGWSGADDMTHTWANAGIAGANSQTMRINEHLGTLAVLPTWSNIGSHRDALCTRCCNGPKRKLLPASEGWCAAQTVAARNHGQRGCRKQTFNVWSLAFLTAAEQAS